MATNNLGWTLMLAPPSAPAFQDYERDPDGREMSGTGTLNPQKWGAYIGGVRELVGEDAWNSAIQAGYITPSGEKNERALPPLAPEYGNLPGDKMWYPTPQGATPDYVDPNYGPLTIGEKSNEWNPTGLIIFIAAAASMGAAAYFAPAIATVAPAAAAEVGGTAAAAGAGMGGGTASLFGPGAGLAADLTAPALTPAFTAGGVAAGMPAAIPGITAPAAIAGGAGIAGGTPGLFGPTPPGAGSLATPGVTLGDLVNNPMTGDPSLDPPPATDPGPMTGDPSLDPPPTTDPGPMTGDPSLDPPPTTAETPPANAGGPPPKVPGGTTLGDLIDNPFIRGGLGLAGAIIARRGIKDATNAANQGIDNAVNAVTGIVRGTTPTAGTGGSNPTKPPGTAGGTGNPYGLPQLGADGTYEGGLVGMWNPYVQAGYDALNRTGSRPASNLYGKFGAPVVAPNGLTLGKLARPKFARRN